ncbi:MAG: mevalonate kinase [Anaerolineaceae bacterium]|nr:mevalonate kinase [Anaerolineaceae bacterium]
MPAIFSLTPAKAILLGEHAVVYGMPAIAVPVNQLKTKVIINALPQATPGTVQINSPNIGLSTELEQLADENPIAKAIHLVLKHFNISLAPSFRMDITSSIPVASGLGSSAATAVGIIRSLSSFFGHPLDDKQVCEYAYEVEKTVHGNPSGIDNTVVTYNKPIYFMKGQPIEILSVKRPLIFIIADSGVKPPTSQTISQVKQALEADPVLYNDLFKKIGECCMEGRIAIESGNLALIGRMMDLNQQILMQMNLSTPKLDCLIKAAKSAGALGCKLSGGGGGGNMITLVDEDCEDQVHEALETAGAENIWVTTVK